MSFGKDAAIEKMRRAGVSPTPIAIFGNYWDQVARGATGLIPEATITGLTHPEVMPEDDDGGEALSATALIKLNGGLGTSMGLDKAKSLLTVKEGLSFLDIIVRQVLWARSRHGVRLPLIFLHSFNTRTDVLSALGAYPELQVGDLPFDMMQSEEPKLRRSDLAPVEWPANPHLEWCPPGHGDLYPTMLDCGILDALIEAGFEYACVSNSDNLGAAPSPALAAWFARTQAPFATEVTHRTPMDLKGGHIAVRTSDGRLILRESAQTSPEEMRYFTDPGIHPHAHCNNLWLNLRAVRQTLEERSGVLDLPLILNSKVVDPRDPDSEPVYQLESAMGAAIESFPGARAVGVPRSRFLPVKTTSDLALLRSDLFDLGEDYLLRARFPLPTIKLGSAYSTYTALDQRIPHPLILSEAESLTVAGDWSFGRDVRVKGNVFLGEQGGVIPPGAILTENDHPQLR